MGNSSSNGAWTSLVEQTAKETLKPLPEELRPLDLKDYVGQEHLSEQLQTLYNSPRLPSLLLFGPPGCGKSSLALILAGHHSKHILRLSAPEVGLQQLRKQLQGIDILILDELHRFSKAQQDFFLPILESGEITLIATTTENPSFSVTRQLLSRLHVLKLNPLHKENLKKLALSACTKKNIKLDEDLIDFLCSASYGDARTLFNLVEYVFSLPEEKRTLEHAQKALPKVIARHDKNGDSHYELASALIKSIRGSDPNAALYYLASLLEGGEDPRFICRRLIISASEDIGLADPRALGQAVACQQAVEFIGMPEGVIPLSETVVYLALAPKSNSTYTAYHNVSQEIRKNGMQPVPLHLRNASTKLQKEWGYKKGYLYPHDSPTGYIEQEYLPDTVGNREYYFPKQNGEEKNLYLNWKRITKK